MIIIVIFIIIDITMGLIVPEPTHFRLNIDLDKAFKLYHKYKKTTLSLLDKSTPSPFDWLDNQTVNNEYWKYFLSNKLTRNDINNNVYDKEYLEYMHYMYREFPLGFDGIKTEMESKGIKIDRYHIQEYIINRYLDIIKKKSD
jgi:hypothetical protein